MFSKPFSNIALAQVTSAAFLSDTYEAGSELWGCAKCMLNGLTYIMDTSTSGVYWGTSSDAWDPATMGRCCQNDNVGAECLEGTNMWDTLNNEINP